MPWTNYHSHCRYCDGTDEPERYLAQAWAQQMLAYGFSSHAPVPFDCYWCVPTAQFTSYWQEITRLKQQWHGRLQVYVGLEIDYIPDVTGPGHPWIAQLLAHTPLDYTIGSVHFVDAFPDGTRWEVDGSHQLFLQGLEQIFHGDIQQVVRRYFELTRRMIGEARPDIVGHVDKIKIQSDEGRLFSESAPWYQAEVLETLDVIAEAGVMVEVNTRGIYKKRALETYPGRWVLEQMHVRRIPVTIHSDAHHPGEITRHFSDAAALLQQVGFRHVQVLLDGQWQAVPFTPEGLQIQA